MPSKIHISGKLLILAAGLISGCSQKTKTSDSSSQPKSIIAAHPKPTSTPVPSASRQLTVFLPEQDGKLHETSLKEPDDLTQKQLWEPESALTLLFRKAPGFIPAGTQLISVSKNMNYKNPDGYTNTVFEVKLSKEFLNSEFWQDSAKPKLAFDAIVKTAASGVNQSIMPTYPVDIYVLADGKPVHKLGKIRVKNPA